MVDLLGPGDAGAARTLSTTSDVTSPLAGDTWFGDCVGGVAGTGTPIVSKYLNRLLQQVRRAIRASSLSLSGGNADDDLLGQAIQCGGLTYAVAGGSVNAYTITLSPAPVTLPDGMEINVFFGTANTTTTPTLTTNGGSAITVVRQGGGAVAAGDLSGPVSLISKAGGWRINGLAISDLGAQHIPQNFQQIVNAARTVIGSTTGFTTVFSGSFTKKSATSNLVFWFNAGTYVAGATGPAELTVVIGGVAKAAPTTNSGSSLVGGMNARNGIITGVGAGSTAWSFTLGRNDGTAWTATVNPTSTDNAFFPSSGNETTLLIVEVEP